MSRLARRLGLLVVIAAVALAGACLPRRKVAVADDDTVRAMLAEYEQKILELSGQPEYNTTVSNTAPCREDNHTDIRTMAVVNQLLIPIEEHKAVIERVRTGLEADGSIIGSVDLYPDGGAALYAYSADGFIDLTLASGVPPAMSLIITSACYRDP